MYNKVLVPLDGSKMAEMVLKYIKSLAKSDGIGEVILLNVVEIPPIMIMEESSVFAVFLNADVERNKKYLNEIKSQMSSEGIKTRTEVVKGSFVKSIVDFQKKNGIDLTVISAHGYSRLTHLLLGCMAHKVLHYSCSPVMLLRAD